MVEAGSPQEPLVPVADGEQGELFPDSSLPDELVGYRGPAACQIAGITYRQLDYWARTKLVAPSIRTAHGSGSQRLYSFKDILVLKVVKRLLDTGVSLQNIRVAVDHLRLRGVRDLAKVTLFSDGTTVYECTSPEEIVDLLQGGQGVFGIAVSGAMQEISGTIHEFQAERADGGVIETVTPDEFTQRRNARRTG
ncbi:MerR family transcriptional regulator [Amycolatopsis sp. NPDC051071]|uniref:MerR family transcriptional regulator n=1 Tax=Amycolatopsis sp. NPDC051071 TaxID=3154637 RepID=UPI00343AAA30